MGPQHAGSPVAALGCWPQSRAAQCKAGCEATLPLASHTHQVGCRPAEQRRQHRHGRQRTQRPRKHLQQRGQCGQHMDVQKEPIPLQQLLDKGARAEEEPGERKHIPAPRPQNGCCPRRTVQRELRMAMTAAMKKVLSPISDAPITPARPGAVPGMVSRAQAVAVALAQPPCAPGRQRATCPTSSQQKLTYRLDQSLYKAAPCRGCHACCCSCCCAVGNLIY